MSSLITHEREKYEAVWGLDAYGHNSPGQQFLPIFLDMSGATGGAVLDAGTGSGKGALALATAGFDVTCCDLTREGLAPAARDLPFVEAVLWNDLSPVAYLASLHYPMPASRRFDYVYCCDVLEHIPTAFAMLVVSRLLDVAEHGVFLSISTVPDQFGAWVGEPLHATVQSFVQWRDQLSAIGRVVEARDLLAVSCFWVTRR